MFIGMSDGPDYILSSSTSKTAITTDDLIWFDLITFEIVVDSNEKLLSILFRWNDNGGIEVLYIEFSERCIFFNSDLFDHHISKWILNRDDTWSTK